MSPNNRFNKDPNATLDYQIDWSDWLATGDTIASSSWTIESGSGLTKDNESNTTTTTTIWLAGGTVAEQYYSVTNSITTASDPDRIEQRTIKIRVMER